VRRERLLISRDFRVVSGWKWPKANGGSGVRVVESIEFGLVRRGVLRHANQRDHDEDERGRQGKTERLAAHCDSVWDGNRNTALNGMIPDRPVPLE
jgi:hypothetical protein